MSGDNLAGCPESTGDCTNIWARSLSGQKGASSLVFLNAGASYPCANNQTIILKEQSPGRTQKDIVCDSACWEKAG